MRTPPTGRRSCISGRQRAADAVGDAARLLGALDLEDEAGDDLPPAAADVVDRDDLSAGPNAAAGRHRGREADLVPAVVDTKGKPARCHQVPPQAVDQRQRQVAVSDGGAERALLLRSLD